MIDVLAWQKVFREAKCHDQKVEARGNPPVYLQRADVLEEHPELEQEAEPDCGDGDPEKDESARDPLFEVYRSLHKVRWESCLGGPNGRCLDNVQVVLEDEQERLSADEAADAEDKEAILGLEDPLDAEADIKLTGDTEQSNNEDCKRGVLKVLVRRQGLTGIVELR